MIATALAARFDLDLGAFDSMPVTRRHLSDLRGAFADERAYAAALKEQDPLLYTVSTLDPAQGDGQLHCGLGVLMPGRIGAEYFLTKGHLHAWREAAEIYIGLRGEGCMLLEDEQSGESRLFPLRPENVVYVPGRTAHRTINTGTEPLVYLGVYPAAAGHDYGAIGTQNFRKVLVEHNGKPVSLDRAEYLRTLSPNT